MSEHKGVNESMYTVTIYKDGNSIVRTMTPDTLCDVLVHGNYERIKVKDWMDVGVTLKRDGVVSMRLC